MNRKVFALIFTCTIGFLSSQPLPKLIPFRLGDKWGYADSTRKIIIAPTYSFVGFFYEGAAPVCKDGKCGTIDENEKAIIPFNYNNISKFNEGYTEIYNEKDLLALANPSGKFITSFEYKIGDEGYNVMESSGYASYQRVKTKKMGAINKSGEAIIPFKYTFVGFPCKNFMLVSSSGKWGLADTTTRKEIVPCIYTEEDLEEDTIFKYKLPEGTSWNRCNLRTHHKVHPNLKIDLVENGGMGVIDTNGVTIVPFIFDGIYMISEKYIITRKKEQFGLYTIAGIKIKETKYDWLQIDKHGLVKSFLKMKIKKNRTINGFYDDYRKSFANKHVFVGYIDIYGTEYWKD